ncbi:elongation factor P hydroxylase [Amphritea pacifica]|uniref:Elongation factor P hydroxylase n=1 Tax=Amphritea pacifica TaxID=2811233 RepID=A0ABS2WCU1_9GAMM|nr:elongation factor P hydroxylase [Amphritea pacifica]MBN0989536.1 elongation factor P hydroxylase [Amphritea pacifica]MBN1008357.1 elongation factor P hydroxylase [Amphritea pacifica]
MTQPTPESLIGLFNGLFSETLNTELVKGEDEPIYLPADARHPKHRVIFAHGFFASALHEISHWCVAGEQRRQLVDFGYWYKPDGRTAEEQAEFEKVEVIPQALEWLLSQAAGHKFHFSADNLGSDIGASEQFKNAVLSQVKRYLVDGIPERPATLIKALQHYYGTAPLSADQFSLDGK